MARETFTSDFRRFFGRGLGILLPTVLTLWILVQLGVFLYNNVGKPINRGVRIAIIEITPRVFDDDELPTWFRVSDEEIASSRSRSQVEGAPEKTDEAIRRELRRDKFRTFWNQHWYLDASGLIVAIVLIYFSGVLLGGYIGRRLYARLESLLRRLPGFKQVYPHVKQLTELVLGETAMAFSKVVLVQYPRQGIWTVGLLTGASLKSVEAQAKADVVTVFIPSTPTPFTGFTINVPRAEIVEIPMQVEEAIRYFITGGVLVPENEARDPAQISSAGQIPGESPDPDEIAEQMRVAAENAADQTKDRDE